MPGHVIAFEGLDQSGKQTQAERFAAALRDRRHAVALVSFPDYSTPIGAEIDRALQGRREFAPDVMQLLYVANRYEYRGRILEWLEQRTIVICDRYVASSVAYGEAQGVDPAWLEDIQRRLPQPTITILLDIAPETSLERKRASRDRYESDLALLGRVRASYARQSQRDDWLRLDGAQPPDLVTGALISGVRSRLGLP
jgi:dTMP kinase